MSQSAIERTPDSPTLVPGEANPKAWAALPPDVALAHFSGAVGLTTNEAAKRLVQFGPNVLPRVSKPPWYRQLAAEFVHLFAILLWFAAALAWLAGMPELAWAVVAVILINGAFSYWQQYRAERAIEALEALLPLQVSVRRDGVEQTIPASQIVPGDLLLLTDGGAIPADARVVHAERLRIDTSILTGESRPVPRNELAATLDGRNITEMPNLVFAGTSVATGRGEAVVYATGSHTEFGRIASLTQHQERRPSPLQTQIIRITRLITVLAVVMGLLFFAVGTYLGGLSLAEGFLFALGIIVANVPEGLLPTITLALALGVQRMARRNALVKRLEKIETLGATTVILSDKTGTLTENRMAIHNAWVGGVEWAIDDSGRLVMPVNSETRVAPLLDEMLRTAALCCDARITLAPNVELGWTLHGDPTEGAILIAAARHGMGPDRLCQWPRLAELPFDSTRKRMTTIQQIDGAPLACVKGAMSSVLPRCTSLRWPEDNRPLDDDLKRAIAAAHDGLARRGLRVLAVATRTVEPANHRGNQWHVEEVEQGLTLLGLVAMEDPPRAEVPAAVAACRQAGIRTMMVTGDNGLTAAAIGREIGMYNNELRVVTVAELDSLDAAQLDELVRHPELLFARVSPEHKLRLVEALQRNGEVVAVTGDGVNDAPALRRADIGVAMGRSGTDVAREAADIVLVDDNFASIVAAIEEGRAVYDNLRKFITYIFASNVPEAVPFIAFVLLRIPLPLTVMQILAVDLGTDLLPALALGAEPPEPGIMDRPPRPSSEKLLNFATLGRAYGWLGMIEAGLGLAAFFFAYWLAGWRPGQSLAASGLLYLTATTMSLAGIVACQVGNVLACRSSRNSAFRRGFTRNRLLWIGIALEMVLLCLLIYVPSLARVFGLAPLEFRHWAFLATFPCALLVLEEARKAMRYFAKRSRNG